MYACQEEDHGCTVLLTRDRAGQIALAVKRGRPLNCNLRFIWSKHQISTVFYHFVPICNFSYTEVLFRLLLKTGFIWSEACFFTLDSHFSRW